MCNNTNNQAMTMGVWSNLTQEERQSFVFKYEESIEIDESLEITYVISFKITKK